MLAVTALLQVHFGLCQEDLLGANESDECALPQAEAVVKTKVEVNRALGHVLSEMPAVPQSKWDPNESVAWFLNGLLILMTCAVVADGAWRWHCQSHDACLDCPSDPQPKQEVPAAALYPSSPLSPRLMHCCELSEAVLAGDTARCEALLDAAESLPGGNMLDEFVYTDEWGSTLMHMAARSGADAVLEVLLEKRAQVDPVDCWGETPLHVAARDGHECVCALLVAKGASLLSLNAQDQTPLLVASHAGNDVVCNLLRDYGACAVDLPEEDLPLPVTELVENEPKSKCAATLSAVQFLISPY